MNLTQRNIGIDALRLFSIAMVIPYLAWSLVITMVVVAVKWSDPAEMLHHLMTGWRGGTIRSIFWISSWFLLTLAISAVLLRYLERFPRWVAWSVGSEVSCPLSEVLGSLTGRLARTGSTVVLAHWLILLFMYHLGFDSSSTTDLLVRFGTTMTAAFAIGLLINTSPAALVFSGVPRERARPVTIAA